MAELDLDPSKRGSRRGELIMRRYALLGALLCVAVLIALMILNLV